MMTVDCLFLPKAAPLSIYLPSFPFIYFYQNFRPRPLPTKRIPVQLKDCVLMMLSHWSFSSQSRFGFFLQIATLFPARSIPTIPFDKYQTKSFEDMTILIIAFYL